MNNPFQLTYSTSVFNRYLLLVSFIIFLFIGNSEQWLIAIVGYLFKGLLTTAVIHRGLSHKAFKMPKWIEYPLATISLAGTSASVIGWVAMHREHHRYTDTEKDPHSPVHMPGYNVQFMVFKQPVNSFYAADLLKIKFYRKLHQYHWLLTIIPILILFLIDPLAPLYAWLVPNFFQVQAGTTVNHINHLKFGYRNFDTKDQSYNNWITAFLCFGEGWHNNHHNNPKNPNFGVKWWEFDLGYQFIRLIRKKV
jgi:stearoyl-CoA desaturase (delta-9 desaturase)